jgi:hypothetical protein
MVSESEAQFLARRSTRNAGKRAGAHTNLAKVPYPKDSRAKVESTE